MSARPTTANCESQYVIEVAWIRKPDPSTTRCSVSSNIEWRLRWNSMIHSPFANAVATPSRSASPRAAW